MEVDSEEEPGGSWTPQAMIFLMNPLTEPIQPIQNDANFKRRRNALLETDNIGDAWLQKKYEA